MRLVDTFMFSEPYEADVLWVKLSVEDALVDRWVVVENSYTFQGHFKGHHLKELLASEPRFSRFIEKVHVIECDIEPVASASQGKTLDTAALEAEWRQREQAVPHLLQHCRDDGYVLISDVDECLDTQAPFRRRLLERKMAAGGDVILVPRIRYWFDYDNRGLGRRCVPLVSIGQIRQDSRLGFHRAQSIWKPVVWKHDMIFEYSYCFSREKIMRKFDTFGHTGFEPFEVDAALRYNHRPTSQHRARILGWTYEEWFLRRRLNRRNSPAFVRRHLSELRTDAVYPSYADNRRRDFPQFFPRQRSRQLVRWAQLYWQMYANLAERNAGPQWTLLANLTSVGRRARWLARRRR